MTDQYGGLLEQSAAGAKTTYRALINEGTSGFNALLGGNRAADGRYERLEAHGFYWTASETDPGRAVFYNFGRGAQAVNRHVQGDKRMAVSVRCIKA